MAKKSLSNGYDSKKLEGFLTEIDAADERLATLTGEHMARCKTVQEMIAAVFEAAKDAGVPERAFRTLGKNRRLNKKIDANVAKLEADDADSYDRLLGALGDFVDLPLGKAAADRHPGRQEALDGLEQPPPERADKDALSQVGRG